MSPQLSRALYFKDLALKAEDIYKPNIIPDIKVDGVAFETIHAGKSGKILQKGFISSLNDKFPVIADSMLKLFSIHNPGRYLNSLFVIIKPDNKAFVYSKYPMSVNVLLKRPVEQYSAVFRRDIADITSVVFKDDLANLTPIDGDKFIWLFRENWTFGLYFDLSRKLQQKTLMDELGYYYRYILYIADYLFLERGNNFDKMIKDGWFPFVALIGDGMDKLRRYYDEDKKHPFILNELIDSFDKAKIETITSRWWNNSLFKRKESIIKAGINSYLTNTDQGFINAVKNLITELEGIIRISYHIEYSKKPTTKEIKEYIANKGLERFSRPGSLCFPDKFLTYLSEYIFRGFDFEAGDLPESRPTVAHGVADDDIYSKEFALKIILTLDNIYFFLGNR